MTANGGAGVARNSLAAESHGCDYCARFKNAFVRSGPQRPYFKFPPAIGRWRDAQVLFVGTNPRRSPTNTSLHDRIAASQSEFFALADNRDEGRAYISAKGDERHYRPHCAIVKGIFGDVEFDAVAAASEMFLCASEQADALPADPNVCARRFLDRVVLEVNPIVIYAMGRRACDYFESIGIPQGR